MWKRRLGLWSSGNTVSNNIFLTNDYGVLIHSSTDNLVTGNQASYGWGGIWLVSSANNKLRDNSMLNNTRSFGVSGGELSQFVNDVDLSNMGNDKKVYNLFDKESLIIDPDSFPDLGALIFVNCKDVTDQNSKMQNNYVRIHLAGAVNSTVTRNAVENSTIGILLQFFHDCVISKNYANKNTDYGVRVDGSDDILVLGNNVEENEFESRLIMMQNSSNSIIAENTLGTEGLPVAIYLESSNYINITNNVQSGPGIIYGITLKSSSNNLIQSNTFTKCVPGVWLWEESNCNMVSGNS